MIRLPGQAAGLLFEEDPQTGEHLDEVLRDAALGDPASMPLLEFTLEQLYQQRTDDGLLTFKAYRDLGGIEGAIAKCADAAFAGLSPQGQAAFDQVMRALVNLGEGEKVCPRGGGRLSIAWSTRQAVERWWTGLSLPDFLSAIGARMGPLS